MKFFWEMHKSEIFFGRRFLPSAIAVSRPRRLIPLIPPPQKKNTPIYPPKPKNRHWRPFRIAYSEALPAQSLSNTTVLRAEREKMERTTINNLVVIVIVDVIDVTYMCVLKNNSMA